MTTKLEDLRKCQQDLVAAKQRENHERFQAHLGRAIVSAQTSGTSPWSSRVNRAFAEVWEADFLNLWDKTLCRLQADVAHAKDEARAEAEDVLEETEPIAYG